MYHTSSLADAFGSAELLLRLEEVDLAQAALDAIALVAPDAARLHLFRGWLALARPAGPATGAKGAADAASARVSFTLMPEAPGPSGGGLAAKHFRLALGRDPLEPLAWHGLAAALPEGREQNAAAGRAQRLRSSEPFADLRRGKPYLARAPLEHLHATQPYEQEWTLLLVECLRRLDERQAARDLLAPLLDRMPVSAPAALLAAALTDDPAAEQGFLREAAHGDPAWITARRLWTPEKLPLRLPAPPEVPLPATVAQRIDELGQRPTLLDNGEWRLEPIAGAASVPRNPGPPRLTAQPPTPTQATATAPAGTPPGSPAQPTATILNAPKGPGGGDERRDTPPSPLETASSEVADVLREVQRATQQLFGQPMQPLANGDAVALLVSHRGALARRYGAAVAAEIERRLHRLAGALGERGVRGEILMVDQPAPAALGGGGPVADPAGDAGAKAVAQLVRRARKTIEAGNRRLDAILIAGSDSVIPFHRLPNPSQDVDQAVFSDNPYGSDGGSPHVPDIVVARLPDGGADKGELLLALLQRSIEYHEGWLIGEAPAGVTLPFLRRLVAGQRARKSVGGWGATTASWHEPSEQIYRELDSRQPLMLFPPAGADNLHTGSIPELGVGRLLYFNLHGLPGGANWYGQAINAGPDEALPVALTPAHIAELEPGTICMTEACYGAEVMNRSTTNAMGLRLLERGALAFVGSTATSYGAVSLPLGGADILTQQVFVNLRRGQSIGRALLLARDTMARETVAQQGYLDPDDAKTLLSFVLLGDPWASPYAQSPRGQQRQAKGTLPEIEPIMAVRLPVQAGTIPPSAEALAHRLVAKLPPQFAHAHITAVGQGRPDRIAKGQAGALVFSAEARVQTEDGRRAAQIARITVAHGAARKILLTR